MTVQELREALDCFDDEQTVVIGCTGYRVMRCHAIDDVEEDDQARVVLTEGFEAR